jgi:hypothetical protein
VDPFSLEVEASFRLAFGLVIAPALGFWVAPGTRLTVPFTSATGERRTVSGHIRLQHALRKGGSRCGARRRLTGPRARHPAGDRSHAVTAVSKVHGAIADDRPLVPAEERVEPDLRTGLS